MHGDLKQRLEKLASLAEPEIEKKADGRPMTVANNAPPMFQQPPPLSTAENIAKGLTGGPQPFASDWLGKQIGMSPRGSYSETGWGTPMLGTNSSKWSRIGSGIQKGFHAFAGGLGGLAYDATKGIANRIRGAFGYTDPGSAYADKYGSVLEMEKQALTLPQRLGVLAATRTLNEPHR